MSFELSPGVLVRGSVTAVRGRVSVAQALVTLVVDGERKTSITDADGGFTLRDVPEGRARLNVSHPEYAEAEQTVVIQATGRSDRPFELEPVDLEEPGEISGTVLDAAGNPVSGARVTLGSAASYLPAGTLPRGTAVTDSEGHFTLSGVRPGVHRVEAVAVGDRAGQCFRRARGGPSHDRGRRTHPEGSRVGRRLALERRSRGHARRARQRFGARDHRGFRSRRAARPNERVCAKATCSSGWTGARPPICATRGAG